MNIFFSLNVAEIQDLLDEYEDYNILPSDDSDVDPDYQPEGEVSKDEGQVRVYMQPPIECPDGGTDNDSDDSDEPTCSVASSTWGRRGNYKHWRKKKKNLWYSWKVKAFTCTRTKLWGDARRKFS